MSAGAASTPSLLQLATTLNAERAARDTRCPVARLLRDMPPSVADELRVLLQMDKRTMPNPVIRDTLAAAGYPIDLSPIEAHRRNVHGGEGCKCPSSTTR